MIEVEEVRLPLGRREARFTMIEGDFKASGAMRLQAAAACCLPAACAACCMVRWRQAQAGSLISGSRGAMAPPCACGSLTRALALMRLPFSSFQHPSLLRGLPALWRVPLTLTLLPPAAAAAGDERSLGHGARPQQRRGHGHPAALRHQRAGAGPAGVVVQLKA